MSALENGAGRTARVRRVVTGVDERGRSYVVSDGEAPNVFRSPTVSGFGAAQVWTTPPGPVSNEGTTDPAAADAEIPMYPELGGTVFRVADFPPDSAYDETGKGGLFADIGGDEARRRRHPQRRPSLLVPQDRLDRLRGRPRGRDLDAPRRGRVPAEGGRRDRAARHSPLVVQPVGQAVPHGVPPARRPSGAGAEAAEEEQLAGRQT